MSRRLPPSDRRRLARALHFLREPVELRPGFEARVRARIGAEAPRRGGAVRWLVEPLTVRIKPVWGLALAAVLALMVLVPGGPEQRPGPGEVAITLVAPFPDAEQVAVAGSFSDWQPIRLERDQSTGVFRARLVVPAGVHEYMFVLDGDRWVADPLADSYADDGFGRMNSVLIARRGES